MENIRLLLSQHTRQIVIRRPDAETGRAGHCAAAYANERPAKRRYKPCMNFCNAAGSDDCCTHRRIPSCWLCDPHSLSEREACLGRHVPEVPIAELGIDDR